MTEDYLYDVSTQIKKTALEVREELRQASGEAKTFLEGKLLAYNEVLSLLLTQARAFGLDTSLLGLAGFRPDADL